MRSELDLETIKDRYQAIGIVWDDLHMWAMMMKDHPVGRAEKWLEGCGEVERVDQDSWFAPVIPWRREAEWVVKKGCLSRVGNVGW